MKRIGTGNKWVAQRYSAERFAIRMHACGNELHYDQVRLRAEFVADRFTAIRLLRQGQTIWLKQDARLINYVQLAIEEGDL